MADEDIHETGEQLSKEIFTSYVCKSIQRGRPHAGDIAEASSLSAIPLPPSGYPLWDALPCEVVDHGKLSQLQLEGVLYACTRHQQILPSGERAGFFIGDGAGVGKGRQISGVILDNYVRGRRRHVWLSTSSDLSVDALRDIRDLGAHIQVINGCAMLDKGTRALGLDKDLQEGVLFLTYSTLISAGRAGKSRLEQVLEWLVGTPSATTSVGSASASAAAATSFSDALMHWEGVLVFDECHKAKNFTPGREAQSTKVATAVIELQSLLPNARVLYCSATGVSEVGNMAYMSRMGLWGPSSPFADFQAFLDSMKKRGVSFMELLAMEMKAAGRYVARGLSFRQAEFLQAEAPLTPASVQQYDAAVALWQQLRVQLEQALQLTASNNNGVWKLFWAAQQRFFKLLCIGLKLNTVIAEARAGLASGMCVVIGLQSTGEAAADAINLNPDSDVHGFVSPCRELLLHFIRQSFPVHYAQSQEEAVPVCQQMQQKLEQQVHALQLPPNFLDQIIDELGGPRVVAEMTGRKGRVVRQGKKFAYELRAKPDSSEMDSLNVAEREAFQAGRKLVALISDAASTGISLHAAATAANRARRLHLTIELPWSADKAIQQLGRSHRTNQVCAPLYKLVVSAAGGERRFAAAVARRLQSLGALTRGDRRAAAGLDLSESNFDSPWGRKSLRKMYDHIVLESPQLPNGVTLSALLKDLLELPAVGPAAADDGGRVAAAGTGTVHQQQHTLQLLQHNLPALECLQQLLAAEAAVSASGRKSLPAAGSTAGYAPAELSPDKAGGAGTAALSAAQASMAISELHHELRSCCDMMGIGLGLPRTDTVAEEQMKDASTTAGGSTSKDLGDVRRFLNRLLGLPLGRQNLLFNYFAATLAAEITAARAEGRYNEGVSDLQGSSIKRARPPQLLWDDGSAAAAGPAAAAVQTWVNTLLVDRGVSYEDAARRLAHESVSGSRSSFMRSRRPMFGNHSVLLALQKPGQKSTFTIVRPNTGESFFDMDKSDLDAKYTRITSEVAEPEWRAAYGSSLHHCMHGAACTSKGNCQVGRRVAEVTLLSGSVVRVWGVLEAVLDRRANELPKADRTLRVVRVAFPDAAVRQPTTAEKSQLQDAADGAGLAKSVAAADTKQAPLETTATAGAAGGGGGGSLNDALGILTVEDPTPVEKKLLTKAFKPPKTLHHYFGAARPSAAAAAGGSTAGIDRPSVQQQQPSVLHRMLPSGLSREMSGQGRKQQQQQQAPPLKKQRVTDQQQEQPQVVSLVSEDQSNLDDGAWQSAPGPRGVLQNGCTAGSDREPCGVSGALEQAAAAPAGGGRGRNTSESYVSQDKLQLLAGMGFSELQSKRALWVTNGDVGRAIEWCLQAGS
eukprot:gene7699-7898_t